jgi:SAM-dependent methyltransferase
MNLEGKSVCDLGCGTGFFVDWFKSKGVQDIYGVDITDVSINHLQTKYPNFNFLKRDIPDVSLPQLLKKRFDLVTAFDVIYHITDDRLFEQAVKNIVSLVDDRGYFLVTDYFPPKNIMVADHVSHRSYTRYIEILSSLNFEISEIAPMYHCLNHSIFGGGKNDRLRTLGHKIDNRLAPLYYYIDAFVLSERKSNLKMAIDRKKPALK